MQLSLDTRIRATSMVVQREVAREAVILHLGRNQYFGASEVGAMVWREAQRPVALGHLLSEIVAAYDVEEGEAKQDLFDFVSELIAEGLVAIVDPA